MVKILNTDFTPNNCLPSTENLEKYGHSGYSGTFFIGKWWMGR